MIRYIYLNSRQQGRVPRTSGGHNFQTRSSQPDSLSKLCMIFPRYNFMKRSHCLETIPDGPSGDQYKTNSVLFGHPKPNLIISENSYTKSMQIRSIQTGGTDLAARINIALLDSNMLQRKSSRIINVYKDAQDSGLYNDCYPNSES